MSLWLTSSPSAQLKITGRYRKYRQRKKQSGEADREVYKIETAKEAEGKN